jgi:hypothetical protein
MELGLSRSAWTGSVSRDGAIDDCRLLGELSGDALESLKKVPRIVQPSTAAPLPSNS